MMVDRSSGEIRRGLDELELLPPRPAWRATVHRERADYLLVCGRNGCRPASAQTTGHGDVAQDVPLRIGNDVGDDDWPPCLYRRGTGADACAHRLAVDPTGVFGGKAGGGAES